jgi:uncharacterized repeat protein (TIGR01451 family)
MRTVKIGKAITRLCAVFIALFMGHGFACAQSVNQYSNTTPGAITDSLNCATTVTRTFVVPTSYIVGDVEFGVLLTHTYRGDLRISLRSPVGTTVQLLGNTGGAANNLNVLFDDEGAAVIAPHNTADSTGPAPPYQRSFVPQNPLSAFDGQNAAGTWTMVICDSVAVDSGTFTRADLYITVQQTSVIKTSSIMSDGVNASNPKAIPGATVRYCITITNNGGANMTNVIGADPLPATLTFVPGSILTGTSCNAASTVEDDNASGADESDPFGGAFSAGTITSAATSIAPAASFATVFLAKVK